MARPHDYSALPAHPAVSTHYKKMTKYGWTTVTADVTCPLCGKVRSYALYTLRQLMQKPHFDGKCFKCGHAASRKTANETLRRKYAKLAPRTVRNGYVVLNLSRIDAEDRLLFDAMRGKTSFVFEHRLVMAKLLGRPLRRTECVDHMDGNKKNNHPSNLRIYRMGSGEPGDMPGHGTFYHEWQTAEARARLLQEELDRLRAAA